MVADRRLLERADSVSCKIDDFFGSGWFLDSVAIDSWFGVDF